VAGERITWLKTGLKYDPKRFHGVALPFSPMDVAPKMLIVGGMGEENQ
jgi:hypothetical protein